MNLDSVSLSGVTMRVRGHLDGHLLDDGDSAPGGHRIVAGHSLSVIRNHQRSRCFKRVSVG